MIFKPSATNNIFIEVNAYVAGFSKMCFETTQFNEPMKTHINQLNGGVTVNLTALRYHFWRCARVKKCKKYIVNKVMHQIY